MYKGQAELLIIQRFQKYYSLTKMPFYLTRRIRLSHVHVI